MKGMAAEAGIGNPKPSSSSTAPIAIAPGGGGIVGGGGGRGHGQDPEITSGSYVSPQQIPLDGGAFLLQLLQRPPQSQTSSTAPPPPPAAAVAAPSSLDGNGDDGHRRHHQVGPAVAAIGPGHPSFSPPNFSDAWLSPSPPWLVPPGHTGLPGFAPRRPEHHNPNFPGSRSVFPGDMQQLGFPGGVFDSGGLRRNIGHIQQQPQPQPQPQQQREGFLAENTLLFGSVPSNFANLGPVMPNNNFSDSPSQVHGNALHAHYGARKVFTSSSPELDGLASRSSAESVWTSQHKAQVRQYEGSHSHHERGRGVPMGERRQYAPLSRSGMLEQGRPPGPAHKPNGSGQWVAMNGGQDGKHNLERREGHRNKEPNQSLRYHVEDEMIQRQLHVGTQLNHHRLSLGNNTHSVTASDTKEHLVEMHLEDVDEESPSGSHRLEKTYHGRPGGFARGTGTCQEENVLAEKLSDSLMCTEKSADKNTMGHTNGSRDKDFRSDSRGQQVSSQRVRNRRRDMKCRWDIERLTPSFLSIYESLIPAKEEKAKQKQLLVSLEKLVNKEWPNAQLHLYGSCANSFDLSKSDIDVCLAIDDSDISKSEILLKLADILQSDNLQNVQALTRARVPIVKLMDPVTGISCDICINNILAVVNTKLLRDYAQIDDRVRQLAFIVKHWAKSRGVNETYQGTLSSYAYVLMCIHFLQTRKPAILPCLQEMEATYAVTVDDIKCAYFDQVETLRNFGTQNKESIAELLWAFFNYWAYCHDYTNDVISVRIGNMISKRAKDWTRRIGNDRHLICIEDPFEISHDLGRVVDKYSIKILREEFERAADIMQYDPNPGVTLFEPFVRCSPQE